MNKKISLLVLSIFFSVSLFSQYSYQRIDSIIFKDINGKTFKSPTVGGFNSPQFSQMDLNFDGYMDLIVFDRSGQRITTFLNDGIPDSISYTYAPEYQKYIPRSDNFIISRDYNCDGKMDLFIGRDGIVVYENTSTNGQLSFKEVAKLQSDYGSSIQGIRPMADDMPGIMDIDGDGDIDIMEPYFIGRQMFAYHKNVSMDSTGVCGLQFELRSKCWGNITESNLSSTVYLDSCRWGEFPDAELSTRSVADIQNYNRTQKREKHGSAGISLYDLDNNGSMDMLLGDFDTPYMTALFNDDSIAPHKNAHIFDYDTLYPLYDSTISLRVFPVAYFMDVNNDNINDMIIATNSIDGMDPAYTRKNIQLYLGTGDKRKPFTFHTNTFMDEDIIDFGNSSFPTFFDYDGDGLLDLVVGNKGFLDSTKFPNGMNSNKWFAQLFLFKNTGTAETPEFTLIDDNYLDIPSLKLDGGVDPVARLAPTFYDLNGDGKNDLILGDAKGKIHYFIDTASAGQPAAFKLVDKEFQSVNVFANASPTIVDVNGNGLGDLIIANRSSQFYLHLNLGDSTHPIFNLEIKNIKWQSGNIVRYELRGTPNLSLLDSGQTVIVYDSYSSDGAQVITAIDNDLKYIDVIHPYRTDDEDDETNTTAVIDYSITNLGEIHRGTNSHAVPFAYKHEGELYLLVGGFDGRISLYDSIRGNLKGKFRLRTESNLDENFGFYTAVAAADLNNNGKMDLILGNEAGGLNVLYAQHPLGIDRYSSKTNHKKNSYFNLYPNPTQNAFTIEVGDFIPNTEL